VGLPHVRILMCTCDGAAHLRAQLDSFADQSHADWSLWVSDDGSRDGTRAVLAGFAADHPGREIRVLDGPRAGAAANYLGLLSHPDLPRDGAVIALSDQDDVWMPDRLAQALAHLARHPGDAPVLYAANTVLTDPELRPIRQIRARGDAPGFENALVQNIIAGNTVALNPAAAALVRAAVPPGPVPFHDWWLYVLITGAGGIVAYDKGQRLYYRQHEGSVLGAHRGARAVTRRVRLMLNGTYGGWVRDNLAALEAVASHLTPAHAAQVARLRAGAGRGGWARWRSLRAAGLHRKSRLGTLALAGLAVLGRI
jgi:glycosyltransferase involved in cell wall biosynthesis